MSTGMQGANVEQLMALSKNLTAAARRLDGIRRQTRARLYASTWKGRDFQNFRSQWESKLSPVLAKSSAELHAAAGRLAQEAQQQKAASQAGASGRHSGGPRRSSPGRGRWHSGSQQPLDPWPAIRFLSGAFGLIGALDKFGEKKWVTGRYGPQWQRWLGWGKDTFKFKRWPAVQWLHKVSPFTRKIGYVGSGLGLAAAGNDLLEAWQRRDPDKLIEGTSGVLKSLPVKNPVFALIGLNIDIWSEVGRQAAVIEWDTLGQDLRNTTPKVWAESFAESAQLTGKLLLKSVFG